MPIIEPILDIFILILGDNFIMHKGISKLKWKLKLLPLSCLIHDLSIFPQSDITFHWKCQVCQIHMFIWAKHCRLSVFLLIIMLILKTRWKKVKKTWTTRHLVSCRIDKTFMYNLDVDIALYSCASWNQIILPYWLVTWFKWILFFPFWKK